MMWTVSCVMLYPRLPFNEGGTHCFGFWDHCLLWLTATSLSGCYLREVCTQGGTQDCAAELELRKQNPEIINSMMADIKVSTV